MVYELGGKFGDFTVEAETDLIVITVMNQLSPDGFVYIVHPRIQHPKYRDANFTEDMQALYVEHVSQAFYIEENISQLIECIKSYIPGTSLNRIEFNNQYNEAITELDEDDKKHMKLILLDSYRSVENYESLLEKFHHVLKVLSYQLKSKEASSEDLIKRHAAKKLAAMNTENENVELDVLDEIIEEVIDNGNVAEDNYGLPNVDDGE